jgi:hypothetical protein
MMVPVAQLLLEVVVSEEEVVLVVPAVQLLVVQMVVEEPLVLGGPCLELKVLMEESVQMEALVKILLICASSSTIHPSTDCHLVHVVPVLPGQQVQRP